MKTYHKSVVAKIMREQELRTIEAAYYILGRREDWAVAARKRNNARKKAKAYWGRKYSEMLN